MILIYAFVLFRTTNYCFATLTRSFSDTPQLVNKNRSCAFSIKYSLCVRSEVVSQIPFSTQRGISNPLVRNLLIEVDMLFGRRRSVSLRPHP